MLMLAFVSAAFLAAGSPAPAAAGTCVAHIKRTACKGQAAESYKKCDGKRECDSPVEGAIASADKCAEAVAKRDCPNSRTNVTFSKVVTVTFDGKPVTVDGEKDMCFSKHYPKEQRAKEFARCDPE